MAYKATKTKDSSFEQDFAESVDDVIKSHSYILLTPSGVTQLLWENERDHQ